MSNPRELLSYVNGEIMPHSQAMALLQQRQSAQSPGGYYDAERTFGGQIFKLRQHLERIYNGLHFSQIDPGLTIDELESITQGLLDSNRSLLNPGEDFTITQVMSFDSSSPEEEKSQVDIVVYFQPMDFTAFAASYIRGVKLVTPVTYDIPGRSTQGGANVGGQLALPLMTSREGRITECQGANFMFIQDGRIKLPDRHNVLPGVSMQTVLELAESLSIEVDEDDYSTYDVYMADEAFVSSTRYCMLPVATINGYSQGERMPGPVTLKLIAAWRNLVGMDFVRQALDHLPISEDGTPPDQT